MNIIPINSIDRNFKFVDKTLTDLAYFVKDSLNEKCPDELKQAGINIVNSVFIADNPGLSNIEYPLLKVYRLSSSYKKYGGSRLSTLSMSYSLSYPQLDQLPGLLNWVDTNIYLSLQEYDQLCEFNARTYRLNLFPIRSEYRTMINEQTQVSYPFLRFILQIQE